MPSSRLLRLDLGDLAVEVAHQLGQLLVHAQRLAVGQAGQLPVLLQHRRCRPTAPCADPVEVVGGRRRLLGDQVAELLDEVEEARG